jgi:autotransporter strand-loop-strand O-heptosyltransferase|tara:strand:+ start:107 stop:2503 length:2397 start_codon:yes stop_codon:yes gene_type:complete
LEDTKPKVFAHGSYIGTGGYNNHTRDFFRHLSKLIDVKFRNFTVGEEWGGNSDRQHDCEDYIDDLDRKILSEQSLWEDQSKGIRHDYKIYSEFKDDFRHNVNIILQETNHNYYWDNYTGPKIAYNVWESTVQPEGFFNKLLEYDQIWVPSKWQAKMTINQGANPNRVKVVPEGVDVKTFNLEKDNNKISDYDDGRFKFIHFGRWDYRKSTKEIIEAFLKTFSKDDPVDLILSVDNKFGYYADQCNTTEERLIRYGIPLDDRLKFKSFVSREDYISFLKKGHVFLSCARSEGWNLPLIEAMACGTPSIYSDCSGQTEFAEGKGLPVKIIGEKSCQGNSYYDNGYTHSLEDGVKTGNYYEPDYDDLSKVMRDAYENYDKHKKQAIIDANVIHEKYNWDAVAEVGRDVLVDFLENYEEIPDNNEINIEFLPSPKVEIVGHKNKKYEVEFLDGGNVIFADHIVNGMWCSLSPAEFSPALSVRINGIEVDSVLNRLKNNQYLSKNIKGIENHLIDLHSNSLGDTIAIMPYLDLYAKKHNVKVYLRGNERFSLLFKKSYPNIKITGENNYKFNNRFEKIIHIEHDFTKPLQQYFAEGLGFNNYSYIRPKIDSFKSKRPIQNKYITFGIHSTVQMKYWNHPDGKKVQGESPYWNELCRLLRKDKITPVCLELHQHYGIEGEWNSLPNKSVNKVGMSLEEVVNYIEHSEFYIGLSSGMAWVAHALGKPVAMIANFTEDWNEFDINCKDYKRITDKSVCHGCWNDPKHKFNPSDWYWCPEHKDTDRQFECHTNITPEQVFNEIKEWI